MIRYKGFVEVILTNKYLEHFKMLMCVIYIIIVGYYVIQRELKVDKYQCIKVIIWIEQNTHVLIS